MRRIGLPLLSMLIGLFPIPDRAMSKLAREDNKRASSCTEPYPAVRWLAEYCMAVNSTDDLESAGVRKCMDIAPRPKFKNGCDEAKYWKEQWCKGLVKRRSEKAPKTFGACVADPNVAPEGVRNGF